MEIGLREYYVKLDNILPAGLDCIGYKCISATSGKELLERARIWFHIQVDSSQLQLWTAGTYLHSVRVDHLAVIPLEHEFLQLRITHRPRAQRTIV